MEKEDLNQNFKTIVQSFEIQKLFKSNILKSIICSLFAFKTNYLAAKQKQN